MSFPSLLYIKISNTICSRIWILSPNIFKLHILCPRTSLCTRDVGRGEPGGTLHKSRATVKWKGSHWRESLISVTESDSMSLELPNRFSVTWDTLSVRYKFKKFLNTMRKEREMGERNPKTY